VFTPPPTQPVAQPEILARATLVRRSLWLLAFYCSCGVRVEELNVAGFLRVSIITGAAGETFVTPASADLSLYRRFQQDVCGIFED
jgi:hypothetical protein